MNQSPSVWLISLGLLALAYLLGSIPTSVWVGKGFFGKDVRDYGSGNAGATNTFRVLGKWPGIAVLAFDILKGWAAMALVHYLSPWDSSSSTVLLLVIAAVLATLGHIFPVFAGFRGGKGIATLLGIAIFLYPGTFPFVIAIFLVIFFITGYVSLGSMVSAIAFPLLAVFIFHVREVPLVALSLAVAIAVPATHHKNIGRLLRGEESRLSIFRRKETGGGI